MQHRERRKQRGSEAVGFLFLLICWPEPFTDDVPAEHVPDFVGGSPFAARLMAQGCVEDADEPSLRHKAEATAAGGQAQFQP